jgi:hypothetical protein
MLLAQIAPILIKVMQRWQWRDLCKVCLLPFLDLIHARFMIFLPLHSHAFWTGEYDEMHTQIHSIHSVIHLLSIKNCCSLSDPLQTFKISLGAGEKWYILTHVHIITTLKKWPTAVLFVLCPLCTTQGDHWAKFVEQRVIKNKVQYIHCR